ncbi:hypothetical protein [Christiangramia echinicola]|uniref:hypothetical protein n=1 Tax=Christiangramia echinicola TaxID=279359 RepID=UPI0012EBDED4|nr:hypothetical protein [Christiangramia echinicola]
MATEAIHLLIEEKGILRRIDFSNKSGDLKNIKFYKDRFLITGALLDKDEKNRKMTYNYSFIRGKLEAGKIKNDFFDVVENKLDKRVDHSAISEAISIIQKKKRSINFKYILIIILILTALIFVIS